jgi:CRISPR-associated protein Csb1
MATLTLETLKRVLTGEAAALRRVLRLQPTAGIGAKTFPPTYSGGDKGPVYAEEKRRSNNGEVTAVLLDSVQSQANRMELALLRGYRENVLKFPLMAVDFTKVPGVEDIGELTLLELPHRIADAAARDSTYDGKKFRDAFDWHKATVTNATPLFATCPQALIFGVWDSLGQGGGLGTKFPRALVGEIIAYNALKGVRPAGRLDPLTTGAIGDLKLYESPDGTITLDIAAGKRGEKGEDPKPKKPSEMGYGHVTPGLENKDRIPHHGGVTFDYAEQTTVLSLNALRRLKFPICQETSPKRDSAAHVTLAALALAAITWQGKDYFLRSRCDLVAEQPGEFEVVGTSEPVFSLDATQAARLLSEAAAVAQSEGLPWVTELIHLQPSDALTKLAVRARELKSGSGK